MTTFKKNNPYLKFLPFLGIYITVILVLHSNLLNGDETRYLQFANNLLHGFYSPAAPNLNLWSAPGYPLLLMPLVLLKLPVICIIAANAILVYLALVFIYKATFVISNNKIATILTIFWGCYFNYYKEMAMVLTEPLAILLVSMLSYNVVKASVSANKNNIVLAGILLGCIALTKAIFGFVILVMSLCCIIIFLFTKSKISAKKYLFICLIALACNVPYLLYTYNLTGKVFYWTDSGGMSLYWMSTPYKNEYGDWKNWTLSSDYENDSYIANQSDSILRRNHLEDYQRIFQYTGIRRDDEFKKVALENIKAHPKKYLLNCFYNTERLLFDNPYSYFLQSPNTGIKVIMPAAVLFLVIGSTFFLLKQKLRLHPGLTFLVSLIIIYLGLSVAVSAYARQFYIIIPIILVIAANILFNRFYNNTNKTSIE